MSSFRPSGALLGATFLLLSASIVRGDGGTVRLVEEFPDLRVTVFTAPAVLRVGEIDVSVMLQDPKSDQPVTAARILVRTQRTDGSGSVIQVPATSAAATNKLLLAAPFTLPSAGEWKAEVLVERTDYPQRMVQFQFEIGPALSPWQTYWLTFTWPLGVVALFLIQWKMFHARKPAVT